MSETALVVRALASDDEADAYWRLHASTFAAVPDVEAEARARRRMVESRPGFHREQVRGAFRDGALVGGYDLEPRDLLVGGARLSTGCIGGVLTAPEHRRQGVARALMLDAIGLAEQRRLALLLLDGIPDLYQRFGYADVHDHAEHGIDLGRALELPAGRGVVRAATGEDAEAMVELYHRFHAPYTGRFARDAAWQRYQVETGPPGEAGPVVATDEAGVVRGYMLLSSRRLQGREVVAEDEATLLALLAHHARLADRAAERPEKLWWRFPPGSWLHYALADLVSLESRRYEVLRGHWMARPGHLPTLLEALRPLWQERAGAAVEIAPEGYGLRLAIAGGDPAIRLTPSGFLQLLFGFRPAWWVASRAGEEVPAGALPALARLFPAGGAWIAGGDHF